VAWLAFDHPALAGRVLYPVDVDRALHPPLPGTAAIEPRNPQGYDAAILYRPWRSYLGDALREGRLPLWDPHRFLGVPFAANSQTAVWYPPNWAFAAGDTIGVLSWLAVLSRLAALLLAYWFFRTVRLHPMAAAAGAIIFVFNGFQTAWAVHPTFIASSMWLPLALGGFTRGIRDARPWGLALAGIGLALSVLGGHVQIALYVWGLAAIWAGVEATARIRAAPRGSRGGIAAKVGVSGLGAFAVGASLASLQLLSTAELSDRIVRAEEPYEQAIATALPPEHLAGLVIPDRFGNIIDDNYDGELNSTETAGYAGVAGLLLAGVGATAWRNRYALAFAGFGLGGVLLALGTPLYRLAYELIPGLSRTRGVTRLLFVVGVAVAGLAAVGLDRLLHSERIRLRAVLVPAGLLAVALLLAVWLPTASIGSPYLVRRVALAAILLVAGGVAAVVAASRLTGAKTWAAAGLLGLLVLDLWIPGFAFHRFQEPAEAEPQPPTIEVLRSEDDPRGRIAHLEGTWLTPNAGLEHRLFDVHGSDTFILRSSVELLSLVEDQLEAARDRNTVLAFPPTDAEHPVLDLVGVRFLAGPGDPWSSELARAGITTRLTAFPAAFLACARPAGAAPLEQVGDASPDELRAVVFTDAEASASDCAGGSARIERYDAEEVVVTAMARGQGIVVLGDAWYPGWTAAVDGRPTPVLRVNHALRGVVVPSGPHTVTFSYRPAWLVPGLVATALGALAALALLVLHRVNRTCR
jgi:hypothetical protein